MLIYGIHIYLRLLFFLHESDMPITRNKWKREIPGSDERRISWILFYIEALIKPYSSDAKNLSAKLVSFTKKRILLFSEVSGSLTSFTENSLVIVVHGSRILSCQFHFLASNVLEAHFWNERSVKRNGEQKAVNQGLSWRYNFSGASDVFSIK